MGIQHTNYYRPSSSNLIYALIPSAGYGLRMGGIKKPYIEISGKPILAYTLEVFQQSDLVDGIYVVVAAGDEDRCTQEVTSLYRLSKVVGVIPGGKTRQESVLNGLKSLPSDTNMVIIHDGVRPFVAEEMIEDTLHCANIWGAAVIGVPVKDTVKEVDDEVFATKTLNRQKVWSIQTPQTFKYKIILQAYLNACNNGIQATDDASLVEILGGCRVKLVMGSYENIKITTPDDLVMGKAILESRCYQK